MHASGTRIPSSPKSLQSVNRQNLTRWQGLSSAWRVSLLIRFRCELSLELGVDIRSKQMIQKGVIKSRSRL